MRKGFRAIKNRNCRSKNSSCWQPFYLMPYDNRNKFTEAHGGFDTFAEVWQHVEGKREEYDKLDDAALQARKELDEKISDKKSFAQQLKVAGYDNFAERIS